MDTLTSKERSKQMSLIKGKDTNPELTIRSLVHGMGYRYRKHGKGLPGRPDLVFSRKRKVIFIHGCFWHRHNCSLARLPKSRQDFWVPKLEGNKQRDAQNLQKLKSLNWGTLVIWECEIRKTDHLIKKIKGFLNA